MPVEANSLNSSFLDSILCILGGNVTRLEIVVSSAWISLVMKDVKLAKEKMLVAIFYEIYKTILPQVGNKWCTEGNWPCFSVCNTIFFLFCTMN